MKSGWIIVAAILVRGLTSASAKSDCQTMQRLAQEHMRMTWRGEIALTTRDLQAAQKEAPEPKMSLTRVRCFRRRRSHGRQFHRASPSGTCPTCSTADRATVAADLHYPIAAATGRDRRGNGLASAEHHVRAVGRRLHPHSPRTRLGLASHRHILGNGAGRPTALHETSVIETVATSHVIRVLLSERVE